MRRMRIGHLVAAVLTAAVLASCTQQTTPAGSQQTTAAEPKVLRDGDGARSVRVDGLHKVRFAEIFLAHRDAKTGKLVAECYNTSLAPNAVPASKDTAPQAWAEGLDFNKMKNEFGVLGASFNGPKIWMPDWIDTLNGVVRDFDGRKVPWVGQIEMGDNTGGISESTPYKPMTIRRGDIGWYKGTTALLLDDAEGNTWIMKGFQVGLKPTYTFEQFVAAGQSQFKKLPPGWKFRVKVLDRDLTERPAGGVATIMADEFFNVYDKTGPGMSDYKP